jgi:signal transduction histidine kinase
MTELEAERRELACTEAVMQAAEAHLSGLEQHLSAMPTGANGSSPSALDGLREHIESVRRQCVKARGRRLDRLVRIASELDEGMGRMVSLAALGELSASVAHEIRNPLCGMLLSVEVLQTKMDVGDSRRVLLDNLHREAEKMEKIVNNLLHFARHYRPRMVRCRMEDIVRRSLDSIKRHLDKNDIEVQIHRQEPDCTAEVDPDLVHQVFRNILLNSVDASPKGSRLDIELGGNGSPDIVTIAFIDHGEGIEKERFERIFDPFFTSKHSGVGLGLSVSRKIVEAHSGRIEVQSEPGRGATFTVLFGRRAGSGTQETPACH